MEQLDTLKKKKGERDQPGEEGALSRKKRVEIRTSSLPEHKNPNAGNKRIRRDLESNLPEGASQNFRRGK